MARASGASSATSGDIARTRYSPESGQKLVLLDEILISKNDNDPRLDRELKDLNTETRRAFRDRYRNLPAEKRNERGTIVFLLGRNLETREDFAFFEEVLAEPPCRSLVDCSKDPVRQEEGHVDIGVGVTLDYTSITALQQLERLLLNPDTDEARRGEALRVVKAAVHAKSERVSRMAVDIEKRFSK
jgi:hypothetical protein